MTFIYLLLTCCRDLKASGDEEEGGWVRIKGSVAFGTVRHKFDANGKWVLWVVVVLRFYGSNLEERTHHAHGLRHDGGLDGRVGVATLRKCHKVVCHTPALVLVHLARPKEENGREPLYVEARADVAGGGYVDLCHIHLHMGLNAVGVRCGTAQG